jgi:N-acetylneuraminate epimerase
MASWTFVLASLIVLTGGTQTVAGEDAFEWHNLPELPHALGGQFVGAIDDHLVVAGGSYFFTPPWSGGTKQWVDTIYVLGHNDTHWQLAGHFPSPLGYGVAISTPQGMLCIGGQTPSGNSRQTLRLRRQGNRITIDHLADLPEAAANMAGALAGDTVYIAGGQSTPTSTAALNNFWALSLSAPQARWSSLPAWQGPPRIFPVMVASGSSVYLMSGADLTGTLGPPLGRKFLADAYRYSPGNGWQSIANLSRPTAGGLGAFVGGKILVLGGNDGSLADHEYEIRDRHPGFSKTMYGFDPETQRWSIVGQMPYALVTTGLAIWDHQLVIAGGEDRPSHRSAHVMASPIPKEGR